MTDWEDGHFVGGAVALDLANTVFRRRPELGDDLLTDPATLGRWLVRAGVLAAGREGAADDAALHSARSLRSALWEVLDARSEGRDVTSAALEPLLDSASRGDVRLGPSGDASGTDVRGALASTALDALRLVLSPPAQGVRTCDRCGWFFVDSSRGRRRRWCSMATCGNQAKAARFRSARS